MNGYQLRTVEQADEWISDPGEEVHAEPGPGAVPPCQGVRRGSVQPCGNWVRIRRR
jgi:hypothetical protein